MGACGLFDLWWWLRTGQLDFCTIFFKLPWWARSMDARCSTGTNRVTPHSYSDGKQASEGVVVVLVWGQAVKVWWLVWCWGGCLCIHGGLMFQAWNGLLWRSCFRVMHPHIKQTSTMLALSSVAPMPRSCWFLCINCVGKWGRAVSDQFNWSTILWVRIPLSGGNLICTPTQIKVQVRVILRLLEKKK